MDKHPECGLCTTLVYTKESDKLIPMSVDAEFINRNMSFDALLRGNAYIHAQSYMIRRSDFLKYIDFEKFTNIFPLYYYATAH